MAQLSICARIYRDYRAKIHKCIAFFAKIWYTDKNRSTERIFDMNVFIMTDLEGVSCANDKALWDESTAAYRHACERLMADLNTAIRAAFDAGADAVSVFDGHGPGGFVPELLDPRAKWEKNYDISVFDGCEAFVIIGAHAKAGTANAFLDHTQSSKNWFSYTVNGTEYGETAQDAAYCGTRGIPVVALSGDAAACTEARALIPGIHTAAVKVALGRFCADCLPDEEALACIYNAVYRGISDRAAIAPFVFPLPADIRVTYTSTDRCETALQNNPALVRIDGRTVGKTVTEIHSFFDILP